METGEDIGQRAVEKIHQHLMIDEPWTLRAERTSSGSPLASCGR